MNYNVFSIPLFNKQAKRLAKKYPSLKQDLENLSEELSNNPKLGTALGNNFFKIRFAITSKGKGKSGGARVITYFKITETTVYLTSIFDKSEQHSITEKEIERLFELFT
jgi:Uncharacterized protein conserved in bacteria